MNSPEDHKKELARQRAREIKRKQQEAIKAKNLRGSRHLRATSRLIDKNLINRSVGDVKSGNAKDENLKTPKDRKDLRFIVDKKNENYLLKTNLIDRSLVWACEEVVRIQGNLNDPNMKDFLSGGCEMVENYIGMKIDNSTIKGYDKFRHCMGHCEAAQHGTYGWAASALIDVGKESMDVIKNSMKMSISEAIKDSKDDIEANLRGIRAGSNGLRCYNVCQTYVK